MSCSSVSISPLATPAARLEIRRFSNTPRHKRRMNSLGFCAGEIYGTALLDARGPRADRFFHDAAVEQVNRAVGNARVARIVRHHADRRAFTMQLPQQVHHGFAVLRVQVTGRLVRQQDGWLADKSARHRDALLLTA